MEIQICDKILHSGHRTNWIAAFPIMNIRLEWIYESKFYGFYYYLYTILIKPVVEHPHKSSTFSFSSLFCAFIATLIASFVCIIINAAIVQPFSVRLAIILLNNHHQNSTRRVCWGAAPISRGSKSKSYRYRCVYTATPTVPMTVSSGNTFSAAMASRNDFRQIGNLSLELVVGEDRLFVVSRNVFRLDKGYIL